MQTDDSVFIITTKEKYAKWVNECVVPLLKKENEANKILEDDRNMGHSEEELWTVFQASQFFKVSTTTIHAWKNKGIIPYIRVNSRIRFQKSILIKLHEKRRRRRI